MTVSLINLRCIVNHELFAACTQLGLEGLVAKRLDSRYEPGVRSKAWVKAKCAAWLEDHAAHRHAK